MAWTKDNVSVLGLRVSGDLDGLTIYTDRYGRKVAFAAAPPTKPLTEWQLLWQRNFAAGMTLWRHLTPEQRLAYRRVCDLARLCMLGHNLWLHAFLAADNHVLETLECQYGIPLVKPPLLS